MLISLATYWDKQTVSTLEDTICSMCDHGGSNESVCSGIHPYQVAGSIQTGSLHGHNYFRESFPDMSVMVYRANDTRWERDNYCVETGIHRRGPKATVYDILEIMGRVHL